MSIHADAIEELNCLYYPWGSSACGEKWLAVCALRVHEQDVLWLAQVDCAGRLFGFIVLPETTCRLTLLNCQIRAENSTNCQEGRKGCRGQGRQEGCTSRAQRHRKNAGEKGRESRNAKGTSQGFSQARSEGNAGHVTCDITRCRDARGSTRLTKRRRTDGVGLQTNSPMPQPFAQRGFLCMSALS